MNYCVHLLLAGLDYSHNYRYTHTLCDTLFAITCAVPVLGSSPASQQANNK